MGASVYVVSALFFILFGTGNIQAWNFPEDKDENKTEMAKNGDLKEMSQAPANGDAKEAKETALNVAV